MDKNTLSIKNLAQINSGEVSFGDFTLIVGPQASGKSIFLQLLKIAIDGNHITNTLKTNGFDWRTAGQFLELFFGESMLGMWKSGTEVRFNGKSIFRFFHSIEPDTFIKPKSPLVPGERLFYIPAHRVVAMHQGWPRHFGAFDIGDPYVLRSFSESIRLLMGRESSNGNEPSEKIFPKEGRLRDALEQMIDASIFYGASVEQAQVNLRKQFRLNVAGSHLPFMSWSTGQKEFMPLLLSIYHLLPRQSGVSTSDNLEWIVVEEPEMGLHPRAIQAVMVLLLELVAHGYKVVLSTHSPVLVELAWVMHFIQQYEGQAEDLCELFNLPKNSPLKNTFKIVIEQKTFKTYYFDRQADGVQIKDISVLDAGSDDPAIANWGGLSEFASRASEVVSKLAANEK